MQTDNETDKPLPLPISVLLPNGALVKTRLGEGFIVGHSKVGNGINPNYSVMLIASFNNKANAPWNAYNEDDWRSVELIDKFPINHPRTPANLKAWLLANRAGKVVPIRDINLLAAA